uniref:Uncharacterized protein n=1 Tax=uncultured bacterium CSL142 TaxID=1091569 RepID=G4WVM9_9BACT|nr:hypothetical protein [uncultured bacterium CSL142]
MWDGLATNMKKLKITNSLVLLAAIAISAGGHAAGLTLGADAGSNRESSFSLAQDETVNPDSKTSSETSSAGSGITGFIETEAARTYASPAHWSQGLFRVELEHQGEFGEGLKYKISGRLGYDAVYDRSSFYPPAVRDDQRYDFQLRENYIDASAGDWEMRFGRQQIVWGKMVSLFFADVVSAKDLRQFILPDFDILRIPQWAARAEYFKDDFHAEFIWIPYASYDNIGKPGAEFYPIPANPRFPFVVLGDEQPSHALRNSNYGLRLSTLKDGWDVAGFLYRSFDASPVLAFDPTVGAYRPQHDHITQVGGTLAKDLGGSVVLKAETVYTHGRRYFTNDLTSPTGLVPANTFVYVVGLEFSLPADTNFNIQLFDNVFLDRDPNLFYSKHEAGTTLLLKRSFGHNVDAQALFIRSLDRDDWMFRPQVKWGFAKNWGLGVGADIFDGPPTGFFGQYRNRDRVYTDLRYSF